MGCYQKAAARGENSDCSHIHLTRAHTITPCLRSCDKPRTRSTTLSAYASGPGLLGKLPAPLLDGAWPRSRCEGGVRYAGEVGAVTDCDRCHARGRSCKHHTQSSGV